MPNPRWQERSILYLAMKDEAMRVMHKLIWRVHDLETSIQYLAKKASGILAE